MKKEVEKVEEKEAQQRMKRTTRRPLSRGPPQSQLSQPQRQRPEKRVREREPPAGPILLAAVLWLLLLLGRTATLTIAV